MNRIPFRFRCFPDLLLYSPTIRKTCKRCSYHRNLCYWNQYVKHSILFRDASRRSSHPFSVPLLINTYKMSLVYLFAPVSLYVLETFPPIRRLSSIAGLVIVLVALIAASFATQIWHLIVTQGLLYAIGGSLLYSPTMFYLDQWFGR